jgi:hypothetical protein
MDSPGVLPLTWASNIVVEVEKSGRDLIVGGIASPKEEQPNGDIFRSYRDWALDRTTKRSGLTAPHIRFANAKTDQELITFVKKFGPIWAESIAEEDTDRFLFRAAKQSLDTLHREQRIYAAALDLLEELAKEKKANVQSIQVYLSDIVNGCKHWTSEWQRELAWRESHDQLPPSWHFDNSEWENLVRLNVNAKHDPGLDALSRLIVGSPFDSGHQVICALANAFRIEVTHFGNTRCEAPPLHALLFGVRPVLYYLLRLEYLHTPKTGGAHRCANEFCRQFFLLDREGQKFCSEECSRKQRQRYYWKTRGSKLRRQQRSGRKK